MPIHLAVVNSNKAMLKWMLSCDITLINERGLLERTPLHIACIVNDKSIVKCLLSYEQINVRIRDVFGETPEEYDGISDLIKNLIYKHKISKILN